MTSRRPIAAASCRGLAIVLAAVALSGCTVVDVGVSNPLPEVRRVAIAPFINLSTSPDLDLQTEELKSGTFSDRRFAQAYFAELQKTPGFEVIPVGVVERAILQNRLPMNGPEDYVAAARLIGADAICIGAVTDFDPYHPRLGMHVQWYAVEDSLAHVPMLPYERSEAVKGYLPPRKSLLPAGGQGSGTWGVDNGSTEGGPRGVGRPVADPVPSCLRGQSPEEIAPLYSYTRFFDGRDSSFTARLRDYVELSGDLRSGGWEAYLNRSDDFIRFCSHLMVEEMLLLHGGESRREVIFKRRRQR